MEFNRRLFLFTKKNGLVSVSQIWKESNHRWQESEQNTKVCFAFSVIHCKDHSFCSLSNLQRLLSKAIFFKAPKVLVNRTSFGD